MGLFRKKPSHPSAPDPLPDWDDTRWRGHLRANALGTEHHCGIYVQMINDDRKEAARLFRNDDPSRARHYAESALRNNRTVTALAALNPLSNALYQRSEPLAGYTSLVQIPEPARSGIVTLVFAAARLRMNYLSDTVAFLKEQFGTVHIDQIQTAQGDLYPFVNATVREALSPAPATPAQVEDELASAVKQYFGIDITPAADPPSPAPADSAPDPIPAPERAPSPSNPAADAPPAAAQDGPRAPSQDPSSSHAQTQTDMRRAQTTPISTGSSDFGAPISPELSSERGLVPNGPAPPAPHVDAHASRSRMYAASPLPPHPRKTPQTYARQAVDSYPLAASEHVTSAYPLGSRRRSGDSGGGNWHAAALNANERGLLASAKPPILNKPESNSSSEPGLGTRSINELRSKPAHIRRFDDGDEALILRYEHLRGAVLV